MQSNSQQTEKIPLKCEEFTLGYIFDQKKRFEYIHYCVIFTILSSLTRVNRCSRLSKCLFYYFIMLEEQRLINKDIVYSLPKDFLQLKSLNRLRKSLIMRNICVWIYFWSRRSASNTSLECHLHRSITANPNRPMFSPQQMPLLRSVGSSVLTNKLWVFKTAIIGSIIWN